MSSFYPDDHPIFDMPYFNPEPVEEERFPDVHDIEYIGSIRVSKMSYWHEGKWIRGWGCEHGFCAHSPEDAAANCAMYCEKEGE